ncbi:MAG: TetR/AcrR family transcriptional regulator [Lachnospiraceae bacterium]|nr:TetR/AcrR family transcriptional regulator [Lachnospiraceae bacterium]
MNKFESKYYDTSVRMVKAFLDILETKDFEYITVREICAKAGVNRSTFYLHYETMNDLLEESAEYISDTMSGYFEEEAQVQNVAAMDKKDLYFINARYLTPWLTSIKENRRLFQAALKNGHTIGMDRYTDMLKRDILAPVMQRHGIALEDTEYVIAYYLEGILAMMNLWVKNNCDKDIEDMVELIMMCVNRKRKTTGDEKEDDRE